MASFKYTSTFRRDYKRQETDAAAIARLKEVLYLLERGEPLPAIYRDHKLVGSLARCRECHVRPDLLLLYEVAGDVIVLHRLGSHGDLFRK